MSRDRVRVTERIMNNTREQLVYGSVCSGIEAATVAWHPLEWKPAWLSEIDAFPSAVLAHHYPDTPNLGDFTEIQTSAGNSVDLIVGGTPCQDFSVAGKQAGFDGLRGTLTFAFADLVSRLMPRWVVWENVPGVFSPDNRRGFVDFLERLSNVGYVCAWRVLDAQYVRVDGLGRAVPQRRRRVFVVGHLGDWRRAAAVLLEPESLRGDSPPRRTSGATASALTANGVGTCGADDNQAQAGHLIQDVAGTLNSAGGKCAGSATNQDAESGLLIAHTLTASASASGRPDNRSNPQPNAPCHTVHEAPPTVVGVDLYNASETGDAAHTLRCGGGSSQSCPAVACHGSQDPDVSGDVTHPVGRNNGMETCVAFQTRIARNGRGQPDSVAPALNGADAGATSDMRPCVATPSTVRRLTPRECERLQGFPDDYTLIPYKNKPADRCPDGPRYKALGNSMAVNVMRWIGMRIQAVEKQDATTPAHPGESE